MNDPCFNKGVLNDFKKYNQGLSIFRSPQCPYTEKNVIAMMKTAEQMTSLLLSFMIKQGVSL